MKAALRERLQKGIRLFDLGRAEVDTLLGRHADQPLRATVPT